MENCGREGMHLLQPRAMRNSLPQAKIEPERIRLFPGGKQSMNRSTTTIVTEASRQLLAT